MEGSNEEVKVGQAEGMDERAAKECVERAKSEGEACTRISEMWMGVGVRMWL